MAHRSGALHSLAAMLIASNCISSAQLSSGGRTCFEEASIWPNRAGCRELFIAIEREDFVAVSIAMAHGVSPHCRDAAGDTPLHVVALVDSPQMVTILAAAGADLEARSSEGRTPLHYAAIMNASRTAERLLEVGARADARDAGGATALHLAMATPEPSRDVTRMCDALLKAGVPACIADDFGATPMHYAAAAGCNDQTLELLLSRGACINQEDYECRTPADWAVAHGQFAWSGERFESLLRHGACLGRSERAASRRLAESAALCNIGLLAMLRHFVSSAPVDASGRSVWHHMAAGAECDIATLDESLFWLMQIDPEPWRRDLSGLSPLDVARARGSSAKVAALLSIGADHGE